MSFARQVDRVRSGFLEMPGLELTVPRAGRLWNLGPDDCRYVIDALVDAGFLRWTVRRTVVRTGRGSSIGRTRERSHVSVRMQATADKSVRGE